MRNEQEVALERIWQEARVLPCIQGVRPDVAPFSTDLGIRLSGLFAGRSQFQLRRPEYRQRRRPAEKSIRSRHLS
jgi:hypothetical protein